MLKCTFSFVIGCFDFVVIVKCWWHFSRLRYISWVWIIYGMSLKSTLFRVSCIVNKIFAIEYLVPYATKWVVQNKAWCNNSTSGIPVTGRTPKSHLERKIAAIYFTRYMKHAHLTPSMNLDYATCKSGCRLLNHVQSSRGTKLPGFERDQFLAYTKMHLNVNSLVGKFWITLETQPVDSWCGNIQLSQRDDLAKYLQFNEQ